MEQYINKIPLAHIELVFKCIKHTSINPYWLIWTIIHETDELSSLVEYDNSLDEYRGAGLIMFSTKRNYEALSTILNKPIIYNDLLDPINDASAIYWFIKHRKLNKPNMTFNEFTHLITGAKGKRLENEICIRIKKGLYSKYNKILLSIWRNV